MTIYILADKNVTLLFTVHAVLLQNAGIVLYMCGCVREISISRVYI